MPCSSALLCRGRRAGRAASSSMDCAPAPARRADVLDCERVRATPRSSAELVPSRRHLGWRRSNPASLRLGAARSRLARAMACRRSATRPSADGVDRCLLGEPRVLLADAARPAVASCRRERRHLVGHGRRARRRGGRPGSAISLFSPCGLQLALRKGRRACRSRARWRLPLLARRCRPRSSSLCAASRSCSASWTS